MTDYERRDLELKKKIYIALNRIATSMERGQLNVKINERAVYLNDLVETLNSETSEKEED